MKQQQKIVFTKMDLDVEIQNNRRIKKKNKKVKQEKKETYKQDKTLAKSSWDKEC